ncbi:hypothetical protein LWC34_53345 [Kibdelosporangium philippinense]|uniref:Peptidase inhibitor family I36 n=1 Tax=Kibdelosporangium philippinense TaxID=211113 RepID=A0ABS8ZV22_9PSEU|nr:hypothetical protein [Kibdelosporangium philippinense]MCE7011543.1 hypothetical protein [Kibdelosporangium philippinense]
MTISAVGGLALAGAGTAAAAAPRHCVADIATCFSSEAQVDAFRPAGTAAWTELVRLYDGYNYSGDTYSLGSSEISSCTASTGNVDAQAANLGEFRNRTSSFVTRERCDAKLFDHTGFGGGSTGYLDHSTDLRTIGFNNKAESLLSS